MCFKYCNFVSYNQHAHKQEKLRRWPGAAQAQVCCQRPTEALPGDRVTEGRKTGKDWEGMWCSKSSGQAAQKTEAVGVQDP